MPWPPNQPREPLALLTIGEKYTLNLVWDKAVALYIPVAPHDLMLLVQAKWQRSPFFLPNGVNRPGFATLDQLDYFFAVRALTVTISCRGDRPMNVKDQAEKIRQDAQRVADKEAIENILPPLFKKESGEAQ